MVSAVFVFGSQRAGWLGGGLVGRVVVMNSHLHALSTFDRILLVENKTVTEVPSLAALRRSHPGLLHSLSHRGTAASPRPGPDLKPDARPRRASLTVPGGAGRETKSRRAGAGRSPLGSPSRSPRASPQLSPFLNPACSIELPSELVLSPRRNSVEGGGVSPFASAPVSREVLGIGG